MFYSKLCGVKYSKQAKILSNTYFTDRAMVLGILFASMKEVGNEVHYTFDYSNSHGTK